MNKRRRFKAKRKRAERKALLWLDAYLPGWRSWALRPDAAVARHIAIAFPARG
jgi:hypothetical protein